MYIVYVIGESSEKMLFEDKKKAFDYALEVSKELQGVQVNIYKASLVAVAQQTVAITKIRKPRTVKTTKAIKKIFEEDLLVKAKELKKDMDLPDHLPAAVKAATKKQKPVLTPELLEIAQDALVPPEMDEVEENDIPIGARCALDRNMAVGKKRGPTGEFVYLCVDCMGAITNG